MRPTDLALAEVDYFYYCVMLSLVEQHEITIHRKDKLLSAMYFLETSPWLRGEIPPGMSVEAFRAGRHTCISIYDSLVTQNLYNFELWSVTERNIRRTKRIQPVTWDESSDDSSDGSQGEGEGEGKGEEELPLATEKAELDEDDNQPACPRPEVE